MPDLLTEYLSRIVTQSPYMQGQTYKTAHIRDPFLECQILDDKNTIPTIWLKDDHFFIIAFHNRQEKEVKIIASIKYKHLNVELMKIKEKIFLGFQMKSWDSATERVAKKNQIMKVKGIEGALPVITGLRTFLAEK